MSDLYDAVIVGGGMAGMMAAVTLVEQGKKVAVISKGDPVCCFSTGCIDVLAYGDDPLKGLGSLPDSHPYHLVGEGSVEKALALFRKTMSEGGMPYIGDVHANRKVLTSLGRWKTTCLVPETMEYADFDPDKYIHVISFYKMKDFYPQYITSRYANADYSVFDPGVITTAGIAEKFESRPFLDTFISWLQGLHIPEGRIAIPAVLGRSLVGDVYRQVSAGCDRKVFEIPTLPPSLPGLRLFAGLKNALLRKGVDLYWGRGIYSVEKLGNRIEAVTLANAGRTTRVEGKAFILAAGSFVSGGLQASMDAVTETVFDLPTYLPGTRDVWFKDDFFAPGHEIEKAGIRVDASFRPIETDIENLHVCGSILAFSEIMKNRCGHGMAIATGVAAAQACGGLI
ncbi:MAG TPA: anaerobic glycerol-3-phosphate dehydrogenase subunit B [Syntrophales bacterium]|nr:anaerobic glycerol-3-phosphate dehydrogenase subunit B [Syntrophales bacterium]HPQ43325.1 anaerobic glycerol-3-phosphate dehydrogenase subunit B [Syntrophales bacterium]